MCIRDRISGVTGVGLTGFLDDITALVAQKAKAAEQQEVTVYNNVTEQHRARAKGVRVEMVDGVFVVFCRQAELFAPMVKFGNWRAKLQFHAELDRLGVIEALEKAGASGGDTVRIGPLELEWE